MLEALNAYLQHLNLEQAALTTRLEETCTAQSNAPEGSKLRVVLDVERERLENSRKRIHSMLINVEDEKQFAALHLASVAGAPDLCKDCSTHLNASRNAQIFASCFSFKYQTSF